jgi:hypothetical protein
MYAAKAFDVLERLDPEPEYWEVCMCMYDNDYDVYLDKLQTRGVKKSILYM